MTTYLSAGLSCDNCGLWPMPDPFNAILEGDDIVAFICNDCAEGFDETKPYKALPTVPNTPTTV